MANTFAIHIDLVEVPLDPLAPPSGFRRIYAKSNGRSYQRDSEGNIIELSNQDVLSALGSVTGEPTGFYDRAESSMSFDDTTRTLTLSPTLAFFRVYLKGVEFIYDEAVSITIDDTTGIQFIYFDCSTGVLSKTSVFSEDIITKHAFVSVVYWRQDQAKSIYVAEERHGLVMDGQTHIHMHNSLGLQVVQGGALLDLVTTTSSHGNGGSSSQAETQIGIQASVARDEDIKLENPMLSKPANIPVFYRLGSSENWFRKEPNAYPFIMGGEAGYTGTRPAYNHFDTEWVLSESDNRSYFLVHILVCNDVDYPYVALLGNSYDTYSNARTMAEVEFSLLSGLPFAEFSPIATLIYEVKDAYDSPTYAKLVKTDSGEDYVDWRKNPFSMVNNGSSLTTLAGDNPLFIQETQPLHVGKYIWIQTNIGGDPTKFTVFFEDGL